MKKLAILPLCVAVASTGSAMDLKQSKVTQVVNDVQIISAADQQQKAAAVNDTFSMPDILKTGPSSRAELVAADETVTRVGANTIFSFDPANRSINLKQGSLLFHSPHGKGGGTIHTGSATASVLGTTLIVTTTPDGGMKVLDLEGTVEVKFLNGLKQTLAPGTMTFVLPGGNQIAPIIIFRLDAQVQSSQLVQGFLHGLDSMPLIQQQIKQQLQDIGEGKLHDTPYNVGQDLNTLQDVLNQNHPNPTGVDAALAADATINTSSLSSPGIPTPPTRVFDIPFFTGNPYLDTYLLAHHKTGYTGFAARNLTFNTVHAAPLTVNLQPFAGYSEFDFVATGDINFDGSVTFSGLGSPDLNLLTAGQFHVANGSAIRADVSNFNWESPASLSLDEVSVNNQSGNTSFDVGGDFSALNGSSFQAHGNFNVSTPGNILFSDSSVQANTFFAISANGGIALNNAYVNLGNFGVFTAKYDISINNSSISMPSVFTLTSQNGSVNIGATSIQANTLNVNAKDSILISGTALNQPQFNRLTAHDVVRLMNLNTLNLSAPNLITLQSLNLNNVSYLNAMANTITVVDTTFNPANSYNFGVANGAVTIGAVTPGNLNLINDYLGNTAITSTSQINYTGGASSAAGINVYRH